MSQSGPQETHALPALGWNPSSTSQGTTPGSFAKKPRLAPGTEGRWTFSSPDTPGMPEPSDKTAWDFLPDGWSTQEAQGLPSLGFSLDSRERQNRRRLRRMYQFERSSTKWAADSQAPAKS